MKIIAKFTSMVAVALLAGCASSGTNFDQGKVTQIKKGITTESELVQMFGAPEERTMDSRGQTYVTWSYTESRAKVGSFIPGADVFLGGTKSSQKILMVTLDTSGKVVDFSSSTSGTEIRSGQTQAVKSTSTGGRGDSIATK